MSKKKTTLQSDQNEVFERNTKINVETVAAHERLERELKKLGVEIKPSFNIEPPLGGNRTILYNRDG